MTPPLPHNTIRRFHGSRMVILIMLIKLLPAASSTSPPVAKFGPGRTLTPVTLRCDPAYPTFLPMPNHLCLPKPEVGPGNSHVPSTLLVPDPACPEFGPVKLGCATPGCLGPPTGTNFSPDPTDPSDLQLPAMDFEPHIPGPPRPEFGPEYPQFALPMSLRAVKTGPSSASEAHIVARGQILPKTITDPAREMLLATPRTSLLRFMLLMLTSHEAAAGTAHPLALSGDFCPRYKLPRAGLQELGGGAAMKCIEREVFESEFVAVALSHPRKGY